MLMFLLAALLPVILLFWYVYSKDTNPEPTRYLVKGFCFGALSALLSTFISGPLLNMGFYTSNPTNITEAIKVAFFGAAIPEETAKLIMLWLLLRNLKEFDESYDGIVYATTIGLGFAAFENILYLISAGAGWFEVAIQRAFLAIPGHFGFAVVMGYYYSQIHFKGDRAPKGSKIKVWLYPVLLHGIYDTICFVSDLNMTWSVLLTLVLIAFCIWMFKKTRRRIDEEAADNEYIGSGRDISRHGYDVNEDWTDRPEDQDNEDEGEGFI
jgi:RsiW-degrading membrane proteinase PrsW (M82 family)